jgi:hypothetical protein
MARLPGKYAAIGYVVSKVAVPIIKKKAKAKAKQAPAGAARAGARAAKNSPGKTSLAIGALAGALGYVISRRRRSANTPDTED